MSVYVGSSFQVSVSQRELTKCEYSSNASKLNCFISTCSHLDIVLLVFIVANFHLIITYSLFYFIIIIIIRNLYSAIMPLGGYRGAGGTGR